MIRYISDQGLIVNEEHHKRDDGTEHIDVTIETGRLPKLTLDGEARIYDFERVKRKRPTK